MSNGWRGIYIRWLWRGERWPLLKNTSTSTMDSIYVKQENQKSFPLKGTMSRDFLLFVKKKLFLGSCKQRKKAGVSWHCTLKPASRQGCQKVNRKGFQSLYIIPRVCKMGWNSRPLDYEKSVMTSRPERCTTSCKSGNCICRDITPPNPSTV